VCSYYFLSCRSIEKWREKNEIRREYEGIRSEGNEGIRSEGNEGIRSEGNEGIRSEGKREKARESEGKHKPTGASKNPLSCSVVFSNSAFSKLLVSAMRRVRVDNKEASKSS
jgi:hypothetical protein